MTYIKVENETVCESTRNALRKVWENSVCFCEPDSDSTILADCPRVIAFAQLQAFELAQAKQPNN